MNITRGKKEQPQKVVVYGPEGIGKTTIASKFPNPVFIDTEGSTANIDVARMDRPSSFTMLMQQIKYIKDHPEVCKTLVIDTADWAEQLCITEFCSKKQVSGIEDIGYGKGYVYVAEDFGKMLNLLEEVKDKGINIVITAHAQMRKFEQPDELGAYDRWELKLQKKTAPMLKEWADMVLFANYKTMVINVDNQGAQKGKNKAQGGKRVMYTQHHPCWDAKNRHDLPDEVPFDYSSIAHCIPVINKNDSQIINEAAQEKTVPVADSASSTPVQEQSNRGGTDTVQSVSKQKEIPQEKTGDIPKKLLDLMVAYDVKEADIQEVVTLRGYYPVGTPIKNYDSNFIDGVLVGAWSKVYEMIREQKLSNGEFVKATADEMPFN